MSHRGLLSMTTEEARQPTAETEIDIMIRGEEDERRREEAGLY
jgi:hypothetical protein